MRLSIVRIGGPGLPAGFALAAAALAGACGEPVDPPTATAIKISQNTVVVEDLLESVQLSATVTDQNGETMDDVTVQWLSGENEIASVSSRGLVTGNGVGTVVVWAWIESLSDSATVTVELGSRGKLLRIYDAMGGPGWTNNSNWGTKQPVGEWAGVGTDNEGNVTGLSLPDNGVTGAIPADIALLEHLEVLNLRANDELFGSIPPEIGKLANLVTLNIGNTGVGGSIPPEIGDLRNLTSLLAPRPAIPSGVLSGTIPPEMGKLENLEVLDFSGNGMGGPLPPELGNMRSLRQLQLQGTGVEGPIPAEFGNMQSLTSLRVNSTRLSGRLPNDLTRLSLGRFDWGGTELCAPTDAAFQAWLESINNNNGGRNCDDG